MHRQHEHDGGPQGRGGFGAFGQTGAIPLPNGMTATVTPTVRPETPEEAAEGRRGDLRPIRWIDRFADAL